MDEELQKEPTKKVNQDPVIVQWPNDQTINFGGKFISLSAISRVIGMSQSHLSRIFRGERVGTLRTLYKISKALDMTMQQFLDYRERHVELVKLYGNKVPDEVIAADLAKTL